MKEVTAVTDKVTKLIYEAFEALTFNNLAVLGKPDAAVWDRPVIGIAAGDDGYFDYLKSHIGEFHWSPDEVFRMKYGQSPDRGRLRVISVVFPHTEETKKLQSSEMQYPCENWAVSRGEWGNLTKEFCSKAEKAFEASGIKAAAVDIRPEFAMAQSQKYGRAAVWSHRHAAFAAGMGTFGLSDGFITEKGKAVRITSIIIEADTDITPRGGRGHYDWCLYFRSGICGACIRRCPQQAISENGHDKEKCAAYLTACYDALSEKLDVSSYAEVGCGLCQTKVPCMDRRP